nr:MAG TPA: hypothetical protein [Caudoviricetes sp.]
MTKSVGRTCLILRVVTCSSGRTRSRRADITLRCHLYRMSTKWQVNR